MRHYEFARNLLKGKIAETVFAQMLRETNKYTVLEFGYEKIIPDLIQEGFDEETGIVETLRAAPDFAVIDRESREVHLVEVKYLHYLNPDYILGYAEKMAQSWSPSYLFVATQDGFYFGEVAEVISKSGFIAPMHPSHIDSEIQKKYLKLLADFEAAD